MDSGYLIIGGTRDSSGVSYTRIFVGKVELNGVITEYKTIGDGELKNYGAFYNALLPSVNGWNYYTGYAIDTAAQLLVVKINEVSGNVIVYEYYTPNTYAFQGYKMIEAKGNLYVAGVRTDLTVNSADNILIKIDSNGNRLWQKQYGVNNRLEYAKSLIKLDNGNLMLGSVRNDFNQTNEHSNTWLLEVDTGGNIVRQWFDPSDSTYVAEGLLQTNDGGFIYGAQKKGEQSINDVYKTATIVKLDSNFNKQWVYHCNIISSYTAITDIEVLPDGSIIACGNKPFYQTDSNTVSGWVVKLSAGGNVIWESVYRGINQTQTLNLLTDIDVLSDGGLIAVGQCQLTGATPPQVGWFLKLDSNGCEVENCLVGIDEPRDRNQEPIQIQIQPNPASDKVNVHVEEKLIGGEIKVFDITGKVVLQQMAVTVNTELDVHGLNKGLYLLTIEQTGITARAKLITD